MSNIDSAVLLIAIKDFLNPKFNKEAQTKLDRYDACIMNPDDWKSIDGYLDGFASGIEGEGDDDKEEDKNIRNTAILFRIIVAYQNLTTAPRGEGGGERSINAHKIIKSKAIIDDITSGKTFKEFYEWLINSKIDESVKSFGKIYLFRALLYQLTAVKFVDGNLEIVDAKQMLNLLSDDELVQLLANPNAQKRYRLLTGSIEKDIVIALKSKSKPGDLFSHLTGATNGVVRTQRITILPADETEKITPDGAQLFNQFDENSFNGFEISNEGFKNYLTMQYKLFGEIKKLSEFLTGNENDKLVKIVDYIQYSLNMCNHQINNSIDSDAALKIYKQRYQVFESQITYYMTSVLHDIAVSIVEQIKIIDGSELKILSHKDSSDTIDEWKKGANGKSNNILLTHNGEHEEWRIYGKKEDDSFINHEALKESGLSEILTRVKEGNFSFDKNTKAAVFKYAEEYLGRGNNEAKYRSIDKLLLAVYADTELLKFADDFDGLGDGVKQLLELLKSIYSIAPIYGKHRRKEKLELFKVPDADYKLDDIKEKIGNTVNASDLKKTDFMQNSISVVSSAQIPNPARFHLELGVAKEEFQLITVLMLIASIKEKAEANDNYKGLSDVLEDAVREVAEKLFNHNADKSNLILMSKKPSKDSMEKKKVYVYHDAAAVGLEKKWFILSCDKKKGEIIKSNIKGALCDFVQDVVATEDLYTLTAEGFAFLEGLLDKSMHYQSHASWNLSEPSGDCLFEGADEKCEFILMSNEPSKDSMEKEKVYVYHDNAVDLEKKKWFILSPNKEKVEIVGTYIKGQLNSLVQGKEIAEESYTLKRKERSELKERLNGNVDCQKYIRNKEPLEKRPVSYSTDKLIAVYDALKKFIEEAFENKEYVGGNVVWDDAKRAFIVQLNTTVMKIVDKMKIEAEAEAEAAAADMNARGSHEVNQPVGQPLGAGGGPGLFGGGDDSEPKPDLHPESDSESEESDSDESESESEPGSGSESDEDGGGSFKI